MQRNSLIQTLKQRVRIGFTGLLTLVALWFGLFGLLAPTVLANPIEADTGMPEAGVMASADASLASQIVEAELADETGFEPPVEESVDSLVALESQEPTKEAIDLEAVDTLKSQTEKAFQLVEVNAKQVFVQAKEAAEKASSRAEDAFDEFVVWLKSFSS